eukprot:Gregarina_sp_Pseudo_9__2165@NODE_2514_length_972_cov_422_815648_g2309_i0_p1_GENE_NODE_2514_length_972_cov_422_815648_g2309_i0NODE_2514_length_972_cov_422_815648_g2309_i0_p1_ORF_typecomplete_len173_score7_13_NODE_2514_length_972_cov_422_815648_g2309_i0156674
MFFISIFSLISLPATSAVYSTLLKPNPSGCLRGTNDLDFPLILSPLRSMGSCQILGDWALNSSSWPEFPEIDSVPALHIEGGGGAYKITSQAVNTYVVEVESYHSEACPRSIHTSSIQMLTFILPEKDIIGEVLWHSMLESMKHIRTLEDETVLEITFGDEKLLQRIELLAL